MVMVAVFWRVSPDTRVGGDGSADSNGITPPAVGLHAPNCASLLIVTVAVAVHVCVSAYVLAAAVCEYVPTARAKPLPVSSPERVVSLVAGVKLLDVTAIHSAHV